MRHTRMQAEPGRTRWAETLASLCQQKKGSTVSHKKGRPECGEAGKHAPPSRKTGVHGAGVQWYYGAASQAGVCRLPGRFPAVHVGSSGSSRADLEGPPSTCQKHRHSRIMPTASCCLTALPLAATLARASPGHSEICVLVMQRAGHPSGGPHTVGRSTHGSKRGSAMAASATYIVHLMEGSPASLRDLVRSPPQ